MEVASTGSTCIPLGWTPAISTWPPLPTSPRTTSTFTGTWSAIGKARNLSFFTRHPGSGAQSATGPGRDQPGGPPWTGAGRGIYRKASTSPYAYLRPERPKSDIWPWRSGKNDLKRSRRRSPYPPGPTPHRHELTFGGGRYNLENILAAAACGIALELPLDKAIRGLGNRRSPWSVPGRLEAIPPDPEGRFIYVDYAHTPDALENVLQALDALKSGIRAPSDLRLRLRWGPRPPQTPTHGRHRRPSEPLDLAVVTSDNPRSEDPLSIIQ